MAGCLAFEPYLVLETICERMTNEREGERERTNLLVFLNVGQHEEEERNQWKEQGTEKHLDEREQRSPLRRGRRPVVTRKVIAGRL